MSQPATEIQDLVKTCAIAEVLAPTLATTQQILAIHRLIESEGIPVVRLVHKLPDRGVFRVFFGIQNEPYYCVVIVSEEDEKFIADFAFLEAKVRAYLGIQSQVLEPIAITERIGLTPTRSQKMGELIRPNHSPLIFGEHRWYFEPQADIPGNLEDKLEFLLECLEPCQSSLSDLSTSCDLCISICYEAYMGAMGGWHISKVTMQRIVAMGADVDLDLYARG